MNGGEIGFPRIQRCNLSYFLPNLKTIKDLSDIAFANSQCDRLSSGFHVSMNGRDVGIWPC